MKTVRIVSTFAFAAIAAFPSATFAWGSSGHRIVAAIAWKELGATTRKRIIAILKSAPANSEIAKLRPSSGADSVRNEQWFIAVSTWPDLVRDPARLSHTYHRRVWHYADHFWRDDDGPAHEVKGPPPKNAVERLTVLVADLRKPGSTEFPRAVELAWVIHLMGDIHQPLHNASRISKGQLEGDGGGNGMALTNSLDLHTFWDHIPDEVFESDPSNKRTKKESAAFEGTPEYVEMWRATITKTFGPRVVGKSQSVDAFERWSLEGAKIAEDSVYRGAKAKDAAYQARVAAMSNRAMALAGHRLAGLLTSVFSE